MDTGSGILPEVGATAEISRTVDRSLLTPEFGKPDIEVLASPAVVYLMELASIELVERDLSTELTSVGTGLEFEHLRPSFEGTEVVTKATVRECSPKHVSLDVETIEDGTVVARAKHSRAIAPTRKFARPGEK